MKVFLVCFQQAAQKHFGLSRSWLLNIQTFPSFYPMRRMHKMEIKFNFLLQK